MAVGPQLPPSLDNRKRSHNDHGDGSKSSSGDDRTSTTPDASSKRQRVIGPTLPPAPLDECPTSRPPKSDDEESSEDDGFGPSLPTVGVLKPGPKQTSSTQEAPKSAQRDEWMTLAPVGGDWSARVDPTKLKNRKFATGRGTKAPLQSSGGASDTWHETPEQKQARLKREIMGIKDNSNVPKSEVTGSRDDVQDAATAKKLKEYNKSRGPTLYDAHQTGDQKEEDDPSARTFDREKDIGGGMQINATQRKDMMKKAADFGTRFSSAKYL